MAVQSILSRRTSFSLTKTVMKKMGGRDWTLIKQDVGKRVAGEKAKTAEREVERKAENNSQGSRT